MVVALVVPLVGVLSASPAAADGERSGNAGALLQAAGTTGPAGSERKGSRDGTFSQFHAFDLPVGREGRAPRLGLSYSSAGSTHGSVAAGWSLSAGGAITVDASAGTVRQEWPDGGSAAAPRNFLSPEGKPLVRDESLPEADGYRAVGDNLATRYQYLGSSPLPWWWMARNHDGTTSFFGEKDKHPYSFAPLVRTTEPNGFDDPAEFRYTYTTVGRTAAAPTGEQPREFLLTAIDYQTQGSNASYARVELVWENPVFCGEPADLPAVGSRLDYRSGFARLSGTRKLAQVKTYTKEIVGDLDLRSRYTLGYNAATENCAETEAEDRGAPYRELASVQRTVFRPEVAGQEGPAETVLPATRFTYGKSASYTREGHYGPATTLPNLRLPESIETNQSLRRAPSEDPLDPPSPLLPERYVWTPAAPYTTCAESFCPVPVWDEAEAEGHDRTSYVPPTDAGAWVLATGQSSGESVAVTYVDVNGDRRPDMLKRRGGLPKLAAEAPQTGGCMVDVFLNSSSGFFQNTAFPSFSLRGMMGDIPVSAGTPEDGSGELLCSLTRSFSNDDSGGWRGNPNLPCVDSADVWEPGETQWGAPAEWGSMQQAKHGFMDWDRDGLVDLVTQPIASVDCPYTSTQGIPPPTYHNDVIDERADATPDPHWAPEYLDDVVTATASETMRAITKRQKFMYVYRNTGSGFSATATRIAASSETVPGGPVGVRLVWENIARLPQAGVMAPYSGPTDWTGYNSTLGDFTGDGFPDLWFPEGTANIGPAPAVPTRWSSVRIPLGAGVVPTERKIAKLEDPDPEPSWPGQYTNMLYAGAVDVNGDGLPDKVKAVGEQVSGGFDYTGTRVNFGTGLGYASAADDGEVMFSVDADDTNFLDSYHVDRLSENNWQKYAAIGERWGKTRMQDIDHDGLPDVLFYDREENRARLYVGGGRQWVAARPADPGVAQHFTGRISGMGSGYGGTVNEFDDRADYRYAVTHQAMDINGDGLDDLVTDVDGDGSGVTVRYAKAVTGSGDTAAPARLLRTITNGTGSKTTVSYTSDTRTGNWVASTVSVDPGHGQPAIGSNHRYIRPVFVADLYGRKTFRGYEETHTELNSSTPGVGDNVTHVSMYTYGAHPDGVVALTATVLGHNVNATGIANDQPGVMAMEEYSYHTRDLPSALAIPGARADYPMRTVLPSITIGMTCTGPGGQTFDACRDTAPRVTQETTWEARSVDGDYVMELPAKSETVFVNGEGKNEVRRTATTFNLHWTASGFGVAPNTAVDTAVVDGAESALGGVSYTYTGVDFSRVRSMTVDDAAPGVPDRTTRFHYYLGGPKNGLLRRMWAPEQVHKYDVDTGNDPGYTEYDYDANGVHLTQVTNPLGHTVRIVPDPATGAALDTIGPNYACPDGPDAGTVLDPVTACDFATAVTAGLAERSRTHVDGLGRVTRAVTYPAGDPGLTRGVETFRATFNDRAYEVSPPAARQRVSVVTESLVGDSTSGTRQYSHSTVELDGIGRTLRTAVVQNDAVTRTSTVAYNSQGLPATITEPAGDGEGTTTAVYGYDGLGRTVTLGEQVSPTNTLVLPRQSFGYDGLTVTSTQHTATLAANGTIDPDGDGSPEAHKVITTDPLGQVISVAEKWDAIQDLAVTRYTYDTQGDTASVTDAEGVVTAISHDYSGNRRTITRGGRVWKLDYDRNGDRVAFTEPVPAGASAASYTHSTEYDDLGRIIKSTPAVRDLSPAERDEFKAGPAHITTLTYDTPHSSLDDEAGHANHTIGRLTSTGSPTTTTVSRFNEFGLPVASSQRLTSLPGLAALPGAGDTLTATVTYDQTGVQAGTVQYSAYDAAGLTTFTGPAVHAAGYDRDGSPVQTRIDLGDRGVMTIANNRNSAGVVESRRTNTDELENFAATLTRYDRDHYGRVSRMQTVAFGENGEEIQRYKQTIDHYDNGQISKIGEQLGDSAQPSFNAETEYAYNNRGELVYASGPDYYAYLDVRASGRLNNAGVFDYGTQVPGRRITDRFTNYRYGDGGDPLRLEGLHVDDGTENGYDLATYDYDEAGNTTSRSVTNPDGTTTTYTQRWDGPSSLRAVSNSSTGESETYFYDSGSRVAAVRKNPDGSIASVRRYFGDQEIVYTPGGQPTYRQNLALAGETIGRIDGDAQTGTLEHYTTSSQGHHVLALAAEDAATRRVTRYGAFGEVLASYAGDADGDGQPDPLPGGKYPQEFNGKDHDPVSDLLYYGARYYDPLAIQWASADPLYLLAPDLNYTSPTSANLYTYTANNPIGLIDPNGLDTCSADPAECTPDDGRDGTCVFGDCAATDSWDRVGEETISIIAEKPGTMDNFLYDMVQAWDGAASWWDRPSGEFYDVAQQRRRDGTNGDIVLNEILAFGEALTGPRGGRGQRPQHTAPTRNTRPTTTGRHTTGGGIKLTPASTKGGDDTGVTRTGAPNAQAAEGGQAMSFQLTYTEPGRTGRTGLDRLGDVVQGKGRADIRRILTDHFRDLYGDRAPKHQTSANGETWWQDNHTGTLWVLNDQGVSYLNVGTFHWGKL